MKKKTGISSCAKGTKTKYGCPETLILQLDILAGIATNPADISGLKSLLAAERTGSAEDYGRSGAMGRTCKTYRPARIAHGNATTAAPAVDVTSA